MSLLAQKTFLSYVPFHRMCSSTPLLAETRIEKESDIIRFSNEPKGTFYCQCKPGFELDSSGKCLDVNECATPNACRHGSCYNMDGTYTCKCDPG